MHQLYYSTLCAVVIQITNHKIISVRGKFGNSSVLNVCRLESNRDWEPKVSVDGALEARPKPDKQYLLDACTPIGEESEVLLQVRGGVGKHWHSGG